MFFAYINSFSLLKTLWSRCYYNYPASRMRKLRTKEVKQFAQCHTERKGLNPGARLGCLVTVLHEYSLYSLCSHIPREGASPQNLEEKNNGRTLAGRQQITTVCSKHPCSLPNIYISPLPVTGRFSLPGPLWLGGAVWLVLANGLWAEVPCVMSRPRYLTANVRTFKILLLSAMKIDLVGDGGCSISPGLWVIPTSRIPLRSVIDKQVVWVSSTMWWSGHWDFFF